MEREGLYSDAEITAALNWFASASSDPSSFRARIADAQSVYRLHVANQAHLGRDPRLEALGIDRVASYLAQADALVCDRTSYDLVLGPRIVPFIKQIGSVADLLSDVAGASERASRMLKHAAADPESAIFELAAAAMYLRAGFSVEFIPEAPPERRPDFRVERLGASLTSSASAYGTQTTPRQRQCSTGEFASNSANLFTRSVLAFTSMSTTPASYLKSRMTTYFNVSARG